MMSGPADRASERHDLSIRVMSKDLPGYRALTHDLSRTGVQLETEAELALYSILELNMEFDQEELPNFSCPAEVMWCKVIDKRKTRYRCGLRFAPSNDAEVRNLARMATVLKARSEADLEDLLEEAKRLDPERSDTFLRVDGRAPNEERPEHPGVFIPLVATLTSYQWVGKEGGVLLRFEEGGQLHSLFFPQCAGLTDHRCGLDPEVAGLFVTRCSETVRKLQQRDECEGRKHYRFVAAKHEPVLELVSLPMKSQ